MNLRLILILWLAIELLFPAGIFSQKSKIVFTNSRDISHTSIEIPSLYKISAKHIYIHQNELENQISLVKYNFEKRQFTDSVKINYNLIKQKDYLLDFDFSGDTAILLTHYFISLALKKENYYDIIFQVSNKKKYNQCNINQDKIVVYECYNTHGCGFQVYHLNDLELLNEVGYNHDGMGFTHLVSNYIDYFNGKIIITNAFKSKAIIYDLEGNKIDSLGNDVLLNPNINKIPVNCNFNDPNSNAKDSIYKISNFDKTIRRVQKIFFINDSTILTTIKPVGKGYKRETIFWKKDKDGKWSSRKVKLNMKKADYFNWDYSTKFIITEKEIYFIDAKATKHMRLVTEEYFKKNPYLNLYRYEYNY